MTAAEETWRIALDRGVILTIKPGRTENHTLHLPQFVEGVRTAYREARMRSALRVSDPKKGASVTLPRAVAVASGVTAALYAPPEAASEEVPEEETWNVEIGDSVFLTIVPERSRVLALHLPAFVENTRLAYQNARSLPDRSRFATDTDGTDTAPVVEGPSYSDRVRARLEKNDVLRKLGMLKIRLELDPDLSDFWFTDPSADVVQDPCFLATLPGSMLTVCLSVKGLVSGRGVRVFLNPANRRRETVARFEETIAQLTDPPNLKTGGIFGRYAALDEQELGTRAFLSFEDVDAIKRVILTARARLASRRSPPLDAG